jgi:hypothetical protein
MTVTVWLFCYYDAYYKRRIHLIKNEKILNTWIKNWKDSGMFYSVAEVELEVCERLETYEYDDKR